MNIFADTHQFDINLLQQLLCNKDVLLGDKDKEIATLKASYQLLLEQFNLSQRKRFAASSEKLDGRQDDLFNEAETM